jgi:hypothetical protein
MIENIPGDVLDTSHPPEILETNQKSLLLITQKPFFQAYVPVDASVRRSVEGVGGKKVPYSMSVRVFGIFNFSLPKVKGNFPVSSKKGEFTL